jgi:hypothetical protein
MAALLLCYGTASADDFKTVAVRADMNCVLNNVVSLDDGKMDPKHLAEMIVPICHAFHEAAELAVQPEDWKATPADKARDMEFMHTWANVLWAREIIKQGQGVRPQS